jgi:hypothetical protein
MADAPRDDAALARARLRGKRVALGFVILAAVAIIGSSAFQIIPAVFGAWIEPIPAGDPGSSERACAEGIRDLERALVRSAESAGGASFGERLRPEWDAQADVHRTCERARGGLDAWAALARLRSAEEQLAPVASTSPALEPLRRDVEAHLPADLR